MAEPSPLINGAYVNYANVSSSLEVHDGESLQTRDFASIDYSDSVEIAKVQGTGSMSLGVSIGVYGCEAQIVMYRDAYLRAQDALAAKSPTGAIVFATFDLVVSYADPLTGNTVTDVLRGCRINGRQFSLAPAPDAIQVTLPLTVAKIEIGGRSLV